MPDRSMRFIRVSTLVLLLALGSFTAEAQVAREIPSQAGETTLVRVKIIIETHGIKDLMEINGKPVSNYSPVIIEVFNSTGIALDNRHVMTFLGYSWVDIRTPDPRVEITSSERQKYKGKLIGIDQNTGVAVLKTLEGKLAKTPICSNCQITDGATVMTPIFANDGASQFQKAQIVSAGLGQREPAQNRWVITTDRPFTEVGQPIFTLDHRVLGFVAEQAPMEVGLKTVISPISQMLSSAEKILKTGGNIRTGWLGVFADLQPTSSPGVLIRSIERESPAEKAGLVPEDRILKYNNQQIRDVRQFIQLVQNTPVGTRVNLEINRQGSPMALAALIEARRLPQEIRGKLALNLQSTTSSPVSGNALSEEPLSSRPLVGLRVETLAPPLDELLQIPGKTGLLVLRVTPESPAEQAGILVGDVIVSVDARNIVDPFIFLDYLKTRPREMPMSMKLIRKGIEHNIVVHLPSAAVEPPRK